MGMGLEGIEGPQEMMIDEGLAWMSMGYIDLSPPAVNSTMPVCVYSVWILCGVCCNFLRLCKPSKFGEHRNKEPAGDFEVARATNHTKLPNLLTST